MKRLLLILILTLSFHTLTKADDINDFEIEGISIGDNLLDHFSLEHIQNFEKEYYPASKKFYEQYISYSENGTFEIYDSLTITLKENDSTIYGLAGYLKGFETFEKCLLQKEKVTKSISASFKVKVKDTGINKNVFDYVENNSKKSQVEIILIDKSGLFSVECTDWSKKAEEKNNWIDSLGVSIYSKEYENFLRNEAYK
jgi:hypothetical protein